MNKSVYAIATIAGTIIGVGLFSLPYITLKVGIPVMLFYFLILGFLVTVIHLFFGEIALQTPDYKRLPGFAKIHLGGWAEKVSLVSTILGLFGALLAYLIVGGEFLKGLLFPFFGGSSVLYVLLYFFIGSLLIFLGIKAVAKIQFWGMLLFLIILALIFFKGKGLIDVDNLLFSFGRGNFKDFFLPYGPTLFSLWGVTLIPEAEEMVLDRKQLLKKIIVISTLIPVLVYLFFIFLVLGITGSQTTESGLTGLVNFLGSGAVRLGFLFGLLTTFTSFIAFGLTLKKVFSYDLKIKKEFAWALTCFVPLILFFLGIKQFIPVISFVGGVMLGVDGILILLMYHKIKKKPLLVYPLILIFVLGIIYEIIYFLK